MVGWWRAPSVHATHLLGNFAAETAFDPAFHFLLEVDRQQPPIARHREERHVSGVTVRASLVITQLVRAQRTP
jgi:hypothetical protein